MSSRRAFLAAGAAAAITGCGASPPPPAVVDLTLNASRDLNQDAAGTPRSVQVRVYALSSQARFSSADAYALMDRERATLADEGSLAEAFVMRPGETRQVTLNPKPGVQYIGVAVLFQDIDRARWRALSAVAPSGTTRLALAVGSNSVQLGAA
jgi:type VI secretion system protein VasD